MRSQTRLLALAALFVAWLIAPTSAIAQTRRALVIGNAAYASLNPLRNPPNDATDMARAFEDLGFTVTTARDASGSALRAAVQSFAANLQRGDLAVLYYSGHGLSAHGRNFLLGVDASTDAVSLLQRAGMPIEWALDTLARREVTALLFFDACRSIGEDTEFARAITRSGARTALQEMRAPANMLVAFSTEPGNTASDGQGRNSPFTGALARYIRRRGAEVREVLRLVRQQVLADTGRAQTPWDHCSLTRDVVLSASEGALPAQACSLLGTLRSPGRTESAEIIFVNRTRRDATFAFIDGSGRVRRGVTVSAGRQRRQRTNAGAVWQVGDTEGTCRGLYVATPRSAVVNIDE